MKLPAQLYRQFDADPGRDVPAEGYAGWHTVEAELAPAHTALVVACIGFAVNLVSAALLRGNDHGHGHGHGDDHVHDHNLRAAYLHVVADALTSVLAIVALLCGRYLAWAWVDPVVAIIGALVILKWGTGLLRETSRQLIDLDPSTKHRDQVKAALEAVEGTRVVDLHLWRVGPKQLVCVVSVASRTPKTLSEYKALVMKAAPVDHLTVEICSGV